MKFQEDDYGSSDIDNEFEQISLENPQFDNKEFEEYIKKRNYSNEMKSELYGDDEPYDAQFEEKYNEEEQLNFLQKQMEQ